MRLKIYIIAAVLGVFAVGTSCNKYLDEIPDNRTEITSGEDIAKLLVNAYPEVSPVLAHEYMSDNYTDNGRLYAYSPYSNLPEQFYKFREEITEINQDSPHYIWLVYYRAIAHANKALESIAELGGGAEYNAYKGEALLCRAYAHFMLANVFCNSYDSRFATQLYSGVPYAIESETIVEKSYHKDTLEETYAKIEKDLLEGLPLLDDTKYAQKAYHFTRAAASAFASNFYLFYSKHEDAEIRRTRLENVINYSTVAVGAVANRDLAAISAMSNTDMMCQQWISASEPSNLLLLAYSSRFGRCYTSSLRLGMPSVLNDIVGMGSSGPWGGRFQGTRGLIYQISGLVIFTPKSEEFFVASTPGGNTGMIYIVALAMTKEKALLNRAEAKVLLGDMDGAASDLSAWYTVWQAAPVSKTKDEIINWYKTAHTLLRPSINAIGTENITGDEATLNMLYAVLHARRIETMHEGARIFDLRRYAIGYEHAIDGEESILVNQPGSTYFNPASVSHDLRLTLQLPQMVLEKAPAYWKNPRAL